LVPKVVQDAGYTAVGLGVLALHHLQTRRRDLERKVKAGAAPVRGLLDALPRPPGPIGAALEAGRVRLAEACGLGSALNRSSETESDWMFSTRP